VVEIPFSRKGTYIEKLILRNYSLSQLYAGQPGNKATHGVVDIINGPQQGSKNATDADTIDRPLKHTKSDRRRRRNRDQGSKETTRRLQSMLTHLINWVKPGEDIWIRQICLTEPDQQRIT